MLIYTALIGNSRLLHLNRILAPVDIAEPRETWEDDEGQWVERWEGG